MKKMIFGIGTGRCGTVSLSTLLNRQQGSNISHESKPVLPWNFSKNQIDEKLKGLTESEDKYVGDVASYYLPYVEYILSKYPDTKFICLKRDREEVINSFFKKTIGRNHWVNHFGIFWNLDPLWDKCFPKYITLFKKSALRKYWDQYYEEASNLKKKYPQNIIIIDMESALNTQSGILRLLNFTGIDSHDFVLEKKIKKNSL